MVLDSLDVLAHVGGVNTQHFKELSENGVARLDPMGYGSTLVRQPQTAVVLELDEILTCEAAHHVGNRRGRKIELVGDVRYASITFTIQELLNAFQVIFGLNGKSRRSLTSGLPIW